MNRFSRALVLALLIAAPSAFAQRAIILQLPGGQMVGVAYTPTGQVVLTDITIIKLEPTPNPTKLAAQLIVLRDQTVSTTKSTAAILDLQEKFQKGSPPELFVLDKTDPSKAAQNYVKWKPANAKFPYLFIVGKDGSVLDHGELSNVTDENLAKIAKYQEKK